MWTAAIANAQLLVLVDMLCTYAACHSGAMKTLSVVYLASSLFNVTRKQCHHTAQTTATYTCSLPMVTTLPLHSPSQC